MIPQPLSVAGAPGEFRLGPQTPLLAEEGLAGLGHLLGLHRTGPGGLRLRLDPALAAEGYTLAVEPGGIDLAGGSAAGVFYGVQTLRQLLPAAVLRRGAAGATAGLPCGRIEDRPRYAWRGVLLDVARHFMPLSDVLRFIDLMAFHKLNVLHLHLTDDQGWRVEVPGRPRLVEVGAWRSSTMLGSRGHERYDGRPHGGFYTADDLREVVAYAAQRHVTVVPEVDMPGHMQAAVAAYPHLGNGFAGPVRTAWGSRRTFSTWGTRPWTSAGRCSTTSVTSSPRS